MAVHLAGRDLAVAGPAAVRRPAAAPVRDPQRRHHRHQPAPVHRPGRILAARRRRRRPRPDPPLPRRPHPAAHPPRHPPAPHLRRQGPGRLQRRQRPGRRRPARHRRVLLVPALRRPRRHPHPPRPGRLGPAGHRRHPARAARRHRHRHPAARRPGTARDLHDAITFRLQWRWRIPAARQLAAASPELARLTTAQLGILAGHLRRTRHHGALPATLTASYGIVRTGTITTTTSTATAQQTSAPEPPGTRPASPDTPPAAPPSSTSTPPPSASSLTSWQTADLHMCQIPVIIAGSGQRAPVDSGNPR